MIALPARVPLTRKSISLSNRDSVQQQQEHSSPINSRLARSISVNITTRPQSENSPVIRITTSTPESRSSREFRRESASSITLPPRKIKFEHAIPNSVISEDETTSTLILPNTITHEELKALILEQCAVPPKPLIRIKGTRSDRKWASRSVTVDFDIRINAASLLTKDLANTVVHDHDEPNMSSDLHVHDSSTPPNTQFLDHQIKKFLSDLTPHKMLIMRREVKNWDTEYLYSQLLSIVTSATNTTNETTAQDTKPKIEITFPVTYHKIILQQKAKRPSPMRMGSSSVSITSTLSNLTMTSRSRTTSTSSAATTNTIPTSISSSSSRSNSDSKSVSEHHITTSTWSYATTPPLPVPSSPQSQLSSSPTSPTTTTTPTRQCAVWSEQDWLLQWRDLIISAVRKGRVGWLGSDEYTEGLVSSRNADGRKGWARWWQ